MTPVGDPYADRASLLRAMDDALSNAETSASLRGKEAQRRALMWSGIAQAYAAKLFALAQAVPMCREPHLGLADTRSLLAELHARFTVAGGSDGLGAVPKDTDPLAMVNREAASHIRDMLDELPPVILDYSTINDEER